MNTTSTIHILITFLFVFFICFTTVDIVRSHFTNGSVSLSSLAFDKVIKAHKYVLVAFQEAYPYGDKADEFKKISEASATVPDWLVAHVGVSEHSKENTDLATRYNVKTEDYPAYFLFIRGRDQPVRYKGSWKADDVKSWVVKETGVYIGLSGCVQPLDELARELAATAQGDRPGVLSRLESAAAALTDPDQQDAGRIYVKMAQRFLEKGDGFVNDEMTRLGKLVDGKVSDKKKEELRRRINILTSFLSAPKGETKSEL